MPLHPIPPDPEPTEAEIEEEILRKFSGATLPDHVREIARFFCHARMRLEHPDSFLAPFSTWNPDLNYPAYLKSHRWHEIKSRVLGKAGRECAGCLDQATQVHHRDYRPRVLAGEDDTPLVPLCKSCHDKVHYKEDGTRRQVWQEEERALTGLVKRKDACTMGWRELR